MLYQIALLSGYTFQKFCIICHLLDKSVISVNNQCLLDPNFSVSILKNDGKNCLLCVRSAISQAVYTEKKINIRLDLHYANYVDHCGSTLVVINAVQMSHTTPGTEGRQSFKINTGGRHLSMAAVADCWEEDIMLI